jgi:hypothetical protein
VSRDLGGAGIAVPNHEGGVGSLRDFISSKTNPPERATVGGPPSSEVARTELPAIQRISARCGCSHHVADVDRVDVARGAVFGGVACRRLDGEDLEGVSQRLTMVVMSAAELPRRTRAVERVVSGRSIADLDWDRTSPPPAESEEVWQADSGHDPRDPFPTVAPQHPGLYRCGS